MINSSELEKLSNKGVMFTVHLVDGFYDITPGEVIEYLKDQDLFAAKKRNVSKETWVSWKKHVETHQCSGRTLKGTRCRNGIWQKGLDEFIEGVSEYCSHHQKHGIRQL